MVHEVVDACEGVQLFQHVNFVRREEGGEEREGRGRRGGEGVKGREGARKKEKREEQGREESGQEEWKDEGRERNQSTERIFNTSILLQVLGTYVRMYACTVV